MASWVNLLDILYPKGSLYFSTSEISPSQIIGGIWSCLSDSFYPETLTSDDQWNDNYYDADRGISVQTYIRNGWAINSGMSYRAIALEAGGDYKDITTLDVNQRAFLRILNL